jgi:hypothetical protein
MRKAATQLLFYILVFKDKSQKSKNSQLLCFAFKIIAFPSEIPGHALSSCNNFKLSRHAYTHVLSHKFSVSQKWRRYHRFRDGPADRVEWHYLKITTTARDL